MHENPFDLLWLTLFFIGCLSLPIVCGLITVLIDRE